MQDCQGDAVKDSKGWGGRVDKEFGRSKKKLSTKIKDSLNSLVFWLPTI
jgi:hypothetical protein